METEETEKAPRDFRVDMLQETLLAIVRERSLDGVFKASRTYFNKRPHVAATGTWLVSEHGQALELYWSEHRTQSEPATWETDNESFQTISLTDPIMGAAARQRETIQCFGSGWDRPSWAKKEGIHSCLALPMFFKGDLIGVLGIFFYPTFEEGLKDSARWLLILADYLAAAVSNAKAFETIDRLSQRLEQENEYLREEVRRTASFNQIIGHSEALLHILEQIELVAPTEANVLILGESGTGKELIARAIHDRSRRAKQPFIRVNCAAVPRDLFESEFFGHVRGAFTGAVKDRVGRFQLADSGTLLLDEVGEIPLELQGKLLRVLQEGEFEKIGEDRTQRVSVRVIAVTNRDLRGEAESGHFRRDLFYRLSVFPIEVPPLRDRREDVPLLIDHFVKEASLRLGLSKPPIEKRTLQLLTELDWPGNIRELQNAVERAVILARGQEMDFGFLQFDFVQDAPDRNLQDQQNSRIVREKEWKARQRRNILLALETANWKIQGDSSASALLGMKPTTLRSRMQVLGIVPPKRQSGKS